MNVVEKKPVPIYETECFECHSKIKFCPLCGRELPKEEEAE